MERTLAADRAARALATLPAVQREAVVLFEIDGFSIEEIAVLQRSSITAVKTRLSRGRRRLRAWYGRIEALEPGAGARDVTPPSVSSWTAVPGEGGDR